MRLRNVNRSRRIVDRRGRGGGRAIGGIGGIGLIAVLAIGYFTGIDVTPLLDGLNESQPSGETRELTQAEQEAGDFAARVLFTTEEVWERELPQQVGQDYRPPELVLFSEVVQSGCGGAQGSSGPFYCPADRRAYLDTSFFNFMEQRLGAGGDFAAAYVIAHEVAHHLQNELGILGQVQQLRATLSERESNALQVRVELQADCFAGVWAYHVSDLLERGDLNEALNAAHQIGDDYLQSRAGRQPNPHSFTHGTSAQRMRWFEAGQANGSVADCDTFSATSL